MRGLIIQFSPLTSVQYVPVVAAVCTYLIDHLSLSLPHPKRLLFENIAPLGTERNGAVGSFSSLDAHLTPGRSSKIPSSALWDAAPPPRPLVLSLPSRPDICILHRPEKIIPVYNSPFKVAPPSPPPPAPPSAPLASRRSAFRHLVLRRRARLFRPSSSVQSLLHHFPRTDGVNLLFLYLAPPLTRILKCGVVS